MWRWWKKPRKIVVGAAVYRYTLVDHPQAQELRVYREGEKRLAFRLRLTYPEAWGIDLFRPKAVAYIIGWYEESGRKTPGDLIYLQQESVLLEGLLDLFFLPEEQEQRAWFLERVKGSTPPPYKWEW